jgi:hypothetical protein
MLANGQMIASLLLWLATVVAGAPDATRTSPVPEWAARFDEFMGLLDARGVTFIEGGRDALYLEAGRRWLCIWRETSGLRCYAWTGNAPRIRSFGIFSHDDQTRLPTETDDHLFELRVDAPGTDSQSLSIRRVECASARDELAYSMPPSRRPKARPRRCSREALVVGTRLAATTDETPLTVARAFAGMRPGPEKMDVRALSGTPSQHGLTSLAPDGLLADDRRHFRSFHDKTCARFCPGFCTGLQRHARHGRGASADAQRATARSSQNSRRHL